MAMHAWNPFTALPLNILNPPSGLASFVTTFLVDILCSHAPTPPGADVPCCIVVNVSNPTAVIRFSFTPKKRDLNELFPTCLIISFLVFLAQLCFVETMSLYFHISVTEMFAKNKTKVVINQNYPLKQKECRREWNMTHVSTVLFCLSLFPLRCIAASNLYKSRKQSSVSDSRSSTLSIFYHLLIYSVSSFCRWFCHLFVQRRLMRSKDSSQSFPRALPSSHSLPPHFISGSQ